ncbi:MAG: cadherin-like beta sandwich domain-containing protein, partial [bacterium]
APSSDATLSDLSLIGVTLAQTFDAETTTYTASVANNVVSTTITATATDTTGATITYDTPDDTDGTTDDVDVELIEGENTITVTVTAEDASTNDYTITITRAAPDAPDAPTLPTLTIAADAATFTEGTNAMADFTVSSDQPAPVGGLTATVTLTGADAFVASGERTQNITILATAMTATASFTIADDDADEPNATATATINANAAYSLGSPSTATATINDDEPTLPTLTIVASKPNFTEGEDDDITFTVRSNQNAPVNGLMVTVTLEDADDFVDNTTTTADIAAGERTGTASFTIIDDDGVVDAAATATARISENTGLYQLGTPSSATARICDDDGGACGISAAAEMAVAESLPVVAAAIAGNVASAISNRIDAVGDGDGGNNNLNAASLTASFATQGAAAMADGAEFESVVGDGVKRLLDGKTHSLALSGGGGVSDGAGVWLGGAYKDLGGEDKTLDWDGELYSVQVGADARFNNGALAGAAVSWSEGEWDYQTADDSGKPVEGTIELSTTSVHPYVAWRRAGGMDIWASIGYGEGDLENREETNGAQASGDVALRSASLGVASGDLAVDGASTMRLKFDAQVANMEVDYDEADDADDLDVDSRRVRVGMEFGGGAANGTRRALEFGARYDGGDARSGVGIELGGRLTHDTGDGVSASLNARTLLAHGGKHDEWGVSGTLRYASGADGQGLSWRVEPGWGVTQSGVDRLWTKSAAELASDDSFTPTARMDSEIAHGFAFGEGMLTPYTGLRLSDGARDYRLGGRYKLIALPLEMSVEAYRKQRDANENGVLLKAGITW